MQNSKEVYSFFTCIWPGETSLWAGASNPHYASYQQSEPDKMSQKPLFRRPLEKHPSIFYRYFQGHCSQDTREIIPVPLRRVRINRSSTHSHLFQVSLPDPKTLSRKSSFIPRTCNLWNFLPSSCFPESYNFPSFKSNINELDLISLSS